MCHFVYFCINVTNANYFLEIFVVQVNPQCLFILFYNMVVLPQYQP